MNLCVARVFTRSRFVHEMVNGARPHLFDANRHTHTHPVVQRTLLALKVSTKLECVSVYAESFAPDSMSAFRQCEQQLLVHATSIYEEATTAVQIFLRR